MWRTLIICVLFIPWSLQADDLKFSYGLESFYWEEFDTEGSSLLDESGFRHVLGLDMRNRIDAFWISDLRAHVSFGTMDYDGQDQLGNRVTTDSEYSGYGIEAGFLYYPGALRRSDTAQMGLRMAMGLDSWVRSLKGSGGYDEEYLASYGRVAMLYMQPKKWELELGVRLPIVTSEEVDLSDYGFVETIQVNPRGRPSVYAMFDYPLNDRLGLKLRYDRYDFGKSNRDIVDNIDGNTYSIHQPKSEMQMLGVSLSLAI